MAHQATLEEKRRAMNFITNYCQMGTYSEAEGTAAGRQRTPETRLHVALISGAIRDLFSTDKDIYGRAVDWLYKDYPASVSFDECCDAIGIKKEFTLMKIGEYYMSKKGESNASKRYTRKF